MIFLIECIVACILFTLMVKLATWKKQTAFTNDYPPVVTDKLRTMGLIAEPPRPGSRTTSAKRSLWWCSPSCLRWCCAM